MLWINGLLKKLKVEDSELELYRKTSLVMYPGEESLCQYALCMKARGDGG